MSEEQKEYRLVVVRRAPLRAPEDLTASLEWLIVSLQSDDPVHFTLSGPNPAMEIVPVLEGDTNRVGAFLSTSEIQWNFGRYESDPTHLVTFFNEFEDGRLACLRVSFVAEGGKCSGPGLVAELRLGTEAAGPADKHRGVQLDKLFSYMVSTLQPDYGHVELPGHPDSLERPEEPQVGWITYLSHDEMTVPHIEEPAVVEEDDAGTKIYATRGLGLETYADVAEAIDNVRRALEPEEIEEAAPDPAPPGPAVQKASYMGARPAGRFGVIEDEPSPPDPESDRAQTAPMAPSNAPATDEQAEARRRLLGLPFTPPSGDKKKKD